MVVQIPLSTILIIKLILSVTEI